MRARIIALIILTILSLFILCSCCNDTEVPSLDSYEVLSVTAFVEVETNGFGAVFDQWVVYSVNYIDNQGDVQSITINPNKYNHALAIGTSDKLEITSENHYTLYLTRNTYDKLTGGIAQ